MNIDSFSRGGPGILLGCLLVLLVGGDLAAELLGEARRMDGTRWRGELRLKRGVFQIIDEKEQVIEIAPEELKYLQCHPVSEGALDGLKSGGNGLTGVYHEGRDFSGMSLQRLDPVVDFNWGDRAPISGLKKDQFSVRWTGEVLAPESGRYKFYIVTDDGGRLWIGDRVLIDQWRDQSAAEGQGEIELEKGQRYPLRMDYYESSSLAVAKLLWRPPGEEKQVVPTGYLFPSNPVHLGDQQLGLVGRYFKNNELAGTPYMRVDPEVDFDWGEDSPMRGFGNDNFSVRWTGMVEGPSTGKYVFYIVTNDGGRLWVDGRLLIDQWRSQSATEGRGEFEMEAGRFYSLRFEHFQNAGTAVAKLLWEGPSVPKEVVPNSRLHTGGDEDQPVEESGLLGLYFRGTELTGSPKYRNDPRVDFDWKQESPMSGLKPDQFSVRWQGRLKAGKTEPYTFHVEADDGVRVWLDHDLIIDAWERGVWSQSSKPVELREGEEYDLRIDYFEEESGARIRLLWSSPSIERSVVPSHQLIPSTMEEARRTMMLARKGVPEGVVLNEGTMIARRVGSADETVVRFSTSPKEPGLSTPSVSWLVLQSLPPEMADDLAHGRLGVMLANGDFIDGEFKGLEGNRLKISSVLFGVRSFDRRKVRAVVLGTTRPSEARYEVRSRDGSVFRVDRFSVDDQGISFESSRLGGLRVSSAELLEVRRVSSVTRGDGSR